MPSIAFATSTLHIKPSLSNKTAKFYDLISKSFTFEIYVNSFMLLKSFLQDFGLQFYILSNAFFESNLHVIWRSLCITLHVKNINMALVTTEQMLGLMASLTVMETAKMNVSSDKLFN